MMSFIGFWGRGMDMRTNICCLAGIMTWKNWFSAMDDIAEDKNHSVSECSGGY